MKTLLCIGAVFGLCGTAWAGGLFDPFSGIIEGVAQELAVEPQDGNVVIGSPAVPSMIIDDDSWIESPDMTDNWIQRPDMLDSIMGLAARPVLVIQGGIKADDAPGAAQGVDLTNDD